MSMSFSNIVIGVLLTILGTFYLIHIVAYSRFDINSKWTFRFAHVT